MQNRIGDDAVAANFSDIFQSVQKGEPSAGDAPKSRAKSAAIRAGKAVREGEITLIGGLGVPAGARVSLVNFRQGVDGPWLVKSVRHSMGAGGWISELELEASV